MLCFIFFIDVLPIAGGAVGGVVVILLIIIVVIVLVVCIRLVRITKYRNTLSGQILNLLLYRCKKNYSEKDKEFTVEVPLKVTAIDAESQDGMYDTEHVTSLLYYNTYIHTPYK